MVQSLPEQNYGSDAEPAAQKGFPQVVEEGAEGGSSFHEVSMAREEESVSGGAGSQEYISTLQRGRNLS